MKHKTDEQIEKYGIVKIEKDTKQADNTLLAIVTFTPGEEIYTSDTVTINNTNCNPDLNDEFIITKIISSTQIQIQLDSELGSTCTNGNMILNTTLENQTSGNTQQAIDAANPFNAIKSGFDNIFGGLISSLILFGPISGIICCICCIIIIFVLIKPK